MAGNAALASGIPCFLARPLMGGALLMGRLSTLAGNLSLLGPIH